MEDVLSIIKNNIIDKINIDTMKDEMQQANFIIDQLKFHDSIICETFVKEIDNMVEMIKKVRILRNIIVVESKIIIDIDLIDLLQNFEIKDIGLMLTPLEKSILGEYFIFEFNKRVKHLLDDKLKDLGFSESTFTCGIKEYDSTINCPITFLTVSAFLISGENHTKIINALEDKRHG